MPEALKKGLTDEPEKRGACDGGASESNTPLSRKLDQQILRALEKKRASLGPQAELSPEEIRRIVAGGPISWNSKD